MKKKAIGVLAAAVLLAGCTSSTTDDDEQARQAAGIHQVAQELVTRPGVSCAQGQIDTQGLPSAPDGSLRLMVTTDQMSAADQEQLLRDAAAQVWESDLSVSTLFLEVRNGPELPVSIGDVLDTGVSFAEATDLESAFGPKPPAPSPLPALDDPGNPAC